MPGGSNTEEERSYGPETGIVGGLGSQLSVDGKPQYNYALLGDTGEHPDPNMKHESTHGKAAFDQWFIDDANVNQAGTYDLVMTKITGSTPTIYKIDKSSFFPIDGQLFDTDPDNRIYSKGSDYHNFHFTMEFHAQFDWDCTAKVFDILTPDDDIFVYIDGRLVADKGGINELRGTVSIDQNGTVTFRDWLDSSTSSVQNTGVILLPGRHSLDVFYAERHTDDSKLEFETTLDFIDTLIPGDYHLTTGSPCVDTGNNAGVSTPTELAGNPRIFDGDGNGTATVDMGAYEFFCTPDNRPPVAEPVSATTYMGVSVEIDVSAAISDPDGDILTLVSATNGTGGDVSLAEQGTAVIYTPADWFVGEDEFWYTVKDPSGGSASALVAVTVVPLLEVYAGADRTISSAVTQIQLDDAFVRGGSTASIQWFVAYKPVGCDVAIAHDSNEHPNVSFDINPAVFAAGKKVEVLLRLTATNGSPAYSTHDDVWIMIKPRPMDQAAPVVAVTCSDVVAGTANLASIVTDDGLPFGQLFYKWELLKAPNGGAVRFTDIRKKDTVATFTEPGTYLVRLTASDGQKEGSGLAAVTVPDGNEWGRLAVYAGEDMLESTPENPQIDFQGSSVTRQMTLAYVRRGGEDVTSETTPPVNIRWTVIGGPVASVIFDDPTATTPAVTFTEPNTYVLQLEASDAVQTAVDGVRLEVVLAANDFVVDAGPDLIVGQFEVATLRGTVKSTSETEPLVADWAQSVGNPDTWIEDTVTYTNSNEISATWSVVSGPGVVEFLGFDADGDEDPNAETPHVRFRKAGEYVLRFEVHWGTAQYTDTVTVTVPPMQASIGYTHMLALDSSGVVWGRGAIYLFPSSGLVDHTNDKRRYVIAFEKVRFENGDELGGIDQIVAGDNCSFAIKRDSGEVWAWGDNLLGYLGTGTSPDDSFVEYPSPILKASNQPLDNIVKMSVSAINDPYATNYTHVLALDKNGKVYSWGYNGYGQLGTGEAVSGRTTPGDVLVSVGVNEPNSRLSGIVDIDSGQGCSIALDINGHVWTWGDNTGGKLGNGETADTCNLAKMVLTEPNGTPLADIVDVAATCSGNASVLAREAFFAVDKNGYVWYWGEDVSGDSTSFTPYPQRVLKGEQLSDDSYLSDIIAVSAGDRHVIALMKNGNVLAWGGPLEALGIGEYGDEYRPLPVYVYAPEGSQGSRLGGMVSITAGSRGCAAIDPCDRIWQWGNRGEFDIAIKMGWSPDHGDYSSLVPRETLLGYVTNLSKPTKWYDTIQLAVDDADSGDTIVVHPGIYRRFTIPPFKNITVRSTDPHNIDIVRQTVVCGLEHCGRWEYENNCRDIVVTLAPPNSSTVDGLTITDGGIGILSGMQEVIREVYDANSTRLYVPYDGDAGSPVISRCHILDNGGTGIMCGCSTGAPLIEDNWISSNGDWYDIHTPKQIYDIAADSLDGIYCKSPDTVIRNNTIVDKFGCGVYYDGIDPNLTIYNCILAGNANIEGKQSYRCKEQGCFTTDDLDSVRFKFIGYLPQNLGGAFNDDYHLTSISPCINTGDPNGTYEGLDIDGQPRVMGGCIDIGADEFSEWSVYAGADRNANKGRAVWFCDAKLKHLDTEIDLSEGRTATWTVTRQPADSNVVIENGETLNATATFNKYGVYELRLKVSNGSVVLGAETVQVTVGPRISAVANPRKIAPGSTSILTGTVDNWDCGVYRTEWSSDVPSVARVAPVDGNPLGAVVNVSEVGIYTVTMKVFDQSTNESVGSASAMIVASRPGIIVEAGDDQEVPPDDCTVRLSGSVIGSADCDVQWYFPEGATNHGGTGTIGTWAQFQHAGTYEVLLKATKGDKFVDADILTITVSEGLAAMDTSKYSAGPDTGIAFLVDPDPVMDANVDNTCPAFDRLEWRLNGLSVSDSGWGAISSQGRLDPTVSFRQPGVYSILMSLYDGDAVVGYDTVVVTVRQPQGRVVAKISEGELEYDECSKVFDGTSVDISLVGRSIFIFAMQNPTYEWSSDREGIDFATAGSLNTSAVIHQTGIYHITLTVKLNGDLVGRDTVTVAVFPNETLCSTGRDYGQVLTGNTLALSKAYLWTNGRMWDSDDAGAPPVAWSCIPAGPVFTPSNEVIGPSVTFTEAGVYTLKMSYHDGAEDSVEIVVEEPVLMLIDSFSATLTSPRREIVFGATMASGVESWTIEILTGTSAIVGTLTGTGSSIALAPIPAGSLGIVKSGKYTARLTARAATLTDVAYADIVLNTSASSGGVVAKLDDVFHDQDISPDNMSAKYVISQGRCDVSGKAYLTGGSIDYSVIVTGPDGSGHVLLQASGASVGSEETGNGLLGTADLTSLPNGIYDIVLTVKSGDFYASDQGQFILSSPLKIGNLTFSQEDLSIPVGGYPISIIRTYDSLAKDTPGDFGYGWSYSFADMNIQLNEERAGMCRSGGVFDRDVTLTMPDGTRATFASRFDSAGSQWTVNYDSPSGVTAQLETRGHDKIVYGGGYFGLDYFWQCDEGDFRPSGRCPVDLSLHDFSGFTLTMPDGTVYNIARHPYSLFAVNDVFTGDDEEDTALYKFQACGKPYLESILLATGEKIVFDVDLTDPERPLVKGAMRYLAGQNDPNDAILLERAGNRIKAVYPPSETIIDANEVKPKSGAVAYVKYDYDTAGNLKSVSRLKERPDDYETTTYNYKETVLEDPQTHEPYLQCEPSDHRITAIRDARGIDIVKYHYDPSGLLAATEDASGGAIRIVHNKSSMKETVTDRLGNVSEYHYDSRGRVLSETKGVATTSYVYGSYSTITYTNGTGTYPVEDEEYGYANAYEDKPCMTTDPAGGVTYYRYDSAGRMTQLIDPELNKTVNEYDEKGNLEATTQYRPKLNASGEIDVSSYKVEYVELTTSRNYCTDGNLLYFSGTTTTAPDESLIWHSASLTCYDNMNRVIRAVQLDPTAAYFSTDVFAGGSVRPHDDLRSCTLAGC